MLIKRHYVLGPVRYAPLYSELWREEHIYQKYLCQLLHILNILPYFLF